jgi:hypothetical protein
LVFASIPVDEPWSDARFFPRNYVAAPSSALKARASTGSHVPQSPATVSRPVSSSSSSSSSSGNDIRPSPPKGAVSDPIVLDDEADDSSNFQQSMEFL